MRTRQKRVATDTWRSLGCRTPPLEHWSRRKPTVEPRWAKQQTKKLRPKPTEINSFMSGASLSLTPDRFKPPLHQYFNTDRSKAVLLLRFLTVCYLFLLSIFILWFTYYVSDIFMSPTEGEGDILFLVRILLASPVSLASASARHFSCLHGISWTGGWILTKFARM